MERLTPQTYLQQPVKKVFISKEEKNKKKLLEAHKERTERLVTMPERQAELAKLYKDFENDKN